MRRETTRETKKGGSGVQSPGVSRWRLPVLWVLVVAASLSLAAGAPERDSMAALAEGNDLVAAGELEAAAAAYESGYDPARPHPTLVYNLGTVMHRLGRLPEAVLWYRRSPETEDPWLQENLWLARRSLGSQQLPRGTFGSLAAHADRLAQAGIAAAWIFLFLVTLASRLPRRLPAIVGLLALTLFLAAFGLHRWGPRAAVLVEDCASSAGELPVGTEAWVRSDADGWAIVGTSGAVCPEASVVLVAPR